jgi:hypothetical protein
MSFLFCFSLLFLPFPFCCFVLFLSSLPSADKSTPPPPHWLISLKGTHTHTVGMGTIIAPDL